jgi:polyhydroxybutyrate depolymerase
MILRGRSTWGDGAGSPASLIHRWLHLLVVIAACQVRAETRVEPIVADGLTRSYRIHTPPQPKGKRPPLVLVFHGGGDNAAGIEKLTRFSALADHEGFLAVYPEAVDHHWNDGRKPNPHVDDVAFVRELIRVIEAKNHADPSRIYATGFSNGAIFCHLLAEKLGDQIAAIAPVSGGIAEPIAQGFEPKGPVSVFLIHGTRDPLVKYEGGAVDHGFGGRTIPTVHALNRWFVTDRCRKTTGSGWLPDHAPDDHCRVEWTRWKGIQDTEVLCYRIEGGGHTWPGGRQYAPAFLVGWVCEDFDATHAIWDFFKMHSR